MNGTADKLAKEYQNKKYIKIYNGSNRDNALPQSQSRPKQGHIHDGGPHVP
jgi:hypothetical protein